MNRRIALTGLLGTVFGSRALNASASTRTQPEEVKGLEFEVYKSGGEFRWRLWSANGNIIASGEGYRSKGACERGIEIVKGSFNAPVSYSWESE